MSFISNGYGVSNSTEKLEQFKTYLEDGCYKGENWDLFDSLPDSRYVTFNKAFAALEELEGTIVVVELGTTRSFTSSYYPGCNEDDPRYWEPNSPEKWDWGAGSFTYLFPYCMNHKSFIFHTVDIMKDHIARCKVITEEFSDKVQYHVVDSLKYLASCKANSIDLLYMDTCDIYPIEPGALHHLKEAKILVRKKIIKKGGLVLIDDVRHPSPVNNGELSYLGKGKYSIPFLLNNGFEILHDGFQCLLKRVK